MYPLFLTMVTDNCIISQCGDYAAMEVLTPCVSCGQRRRFHIVPNSNNGATLKENNGGLHVRRKYSAYRTMAKLQRYCWVSLSVFVLVLCLASVQGDPSWRARPQDADVKLGKNVTLQCGINNRGDLGMLWSKYLEGGRTTSLFINDTSWNAPPRYYVVPHSYGYNLLITNAKRDDDTKYECNIQKTELRAEATIVVLVSPGSPEIHLNTTLDSLTEGRPVQFTCSSAGGNPVPTIMWTRNGETLLGAKIIDPVAKFGSTSSILTMQLTRNDHRANFSCHVTNRAVDGTPKVKTQQIFVKYAPGDPVIHLNASQDTLVEGLYLQVNCTSKGGNPNPDISWRRNGVPLEGGKVSRQFDGTSNILTLLLKREDHRANLTCHVTSDALVTEKVTAQVILVQYAPVIELVRFNPYRVLDQERVILTCGISANPTVPAANVYWFKEGVGEIRSGFTLPFDAVTREDSGKYTCRATNSIGTRHKEMELDVQYSPILRLLNENSEAIDMLLFTHENQLVNITCDVSANPPVDSADIKWMKGETVVHSGTSFVIDPVQRSHAGDYKCQATNQMLPSGKSPLEGQGMKSLQFRVLYKPGAAALVVPSAVIKGTAAELQCSVSDPGEPKAELLWTRLGSSVLIHKGETLILDPAGLSDSGEYVCTPSNDVGDGVPAVAKLTVNERPVWVGAIPQPTLVVHINVSQVEFTCQFRGSPPPKVTWFISGKTLEEPRYHGYYRVDDAKVSSDGFSWRVASTLKLEGNVRKPLVDSLRVEDAGNYTCVAKNAVSQENLSQTVRLIVQYPPILDVNTDKVAVTINKSATLRCHSKSVPPPTFTWHNGTNKLVSSGRVQIRRTDSRESDFPYTSVLTITSVRKEDLGVYKCVSLNSLGGGHINIHLAVKTTPDPPGGLQMLSKTWESLEVSWKQGFDGGYRQNFTLTYIRHFNHEFARMSLGNFSRVNITGLYPSSNYTLRIYATNQLGDSSPSNDMWAYTDALTLDEPGDVLYDTTSRTITFKSPSTYYCARVTIYDGVMWQVYAPCAPTLGGSVKVNDGVTVEKVRVSLCLERRLDVCSPEVAAEASTMDEEKGDLPVSVIIIVACVCGSIVIILSIILIVLCCRRHQAKKAYEQEAANRVPMSPPVMTHTDTVPDKLPPTLPPTAFENRGLDSIDLDDFSPDRSQSPPAYPGRNCYHNPGLANVYLSHGYNDPKGIYTSKPDHMTMQSDSDWRMSDWSPGTSDKKLSPHKSNKMKKSTDDIHLGNKLDSHGSHDSGMSTPDGHKPKKVIYEVIV